MIGHILRHVRLLKAIIEGDVEGHIRIEEDREKILKDMIKERPKGNKSQQGGMES